MSLNVKCGSVIGLPIYGFLVVSNSNIWPNSATLCSFLRYKISLRNLSDLGFDFQGDYYRSDVITVLDSHIWFPINV